MRRVMVLLVVAFVAAIGAAWAEARPVTFEDLLALRTVGSPAMAPDGGAVLYTVRQWEPTSAKEPDKRTARTAVWRVPTGGGEARQLTFGGDDATSPTWSPDGALMSFVAARGGADARPQIWVMRTAGGEAWAITDAKDGVTSYAWSPDSTRVAYVTRDPETKAQEAARKKGDDRRLFEAEHRMAHLWVVSVATREATRLTEGDFTVRGEPTWSPDGTRLAYSFARTPLVRDDLADVAILTVATRARETITTNRGPDTSPRWSPDGATIAFLSEQNQAAAGPDGIGPQDVRQAHLVLFDVARRRARDMASPPFDYAAGSPIWSSDSRRLIFSTGRGVYQDVAALDVPTGRYTFLTKDRVVDGISLSRDGARVALTMQAAGAPRDVYVADAATFAGPKRLTTTNPELAALALGETEVVRWTTDAGTIEGLLLKPVGYTPGTKCPMLVVVHGGPTGAHTNGFKASYADAGQHWAGQGWAVFYPNPRGSTNYGERFMRANFGDWGGGDFRDIMAGVDAMVARGIADPDRLAMMGWSYGGYMTAWAITQTARFKAARIGAGLTNLVSMYGTNDIPNYMVPFFKGQQPTGEGLRLYTERSGLTHVNKVSTPTLILHGAADERVPVGQPMELYRALKDRGRTTELVFYPREGHGLTEYYHQLDVMKRQFDWITRYTLGEGARKTTTP